LKSYVVSSFGDQYYQQRIFTKKSKNAQEAHEAIRPTDISRKPSSL
jgi:DNA topoisomerase-1